MDFWDALSPARKERCVRIITDILAANTANGRAGGDE